MPVSFSIWFSERPRASRALRSLAPMVSEMAVPWVLLSSNQSGASRENSSGLVGSRTRGLFLMHRARRVTLTYDKDNRVGEAKGLALGEAEASRL